MDECDRDRFEVHVKEEAEKGEESRRVIEQISSQWLAVRRVAQNSGLGPKDGR